MSSDGSYRRQCSALDGLFEERWIGLWRVADQGTYGDLGPDVRVTFIKTLGTASLTFDSNNDRRPVSRSRTGCIENWHDAMRYKKQSYR